MREWQQKRQPEYVMPDAVYYQSIWAVRDLARMEERLGELEREPNEYTVSGIVIRDGKAPYRAGKPTENRAMEKVMLETRIRAIRSALSIVPDRYRDFVLANVAERKEYNGYTTKIWKIWKQRFLFHVAKNLSLM